MEGLISQILGRYERGELARRDLIRALAALAAAAPATAAPDSTFHGVEINHIALRVAEIPRSREFYQKHFGLPLISESAGSCFLGMGRNFLTLFRNAQPGLDHYCIAIEGFKPDAVMEELKRQGMNPRRPSGTDRIYFPDPDGLTVQVSAVDHKP